MALEKENYYIKIENNIYRHEDKKSDYEISKIKDKASFISFIDNKNLSFIDKEYLFKIITNDEELLSKYIFCLNLDDLKMISNKEDFDVYKTRIRKIKNYYPEEVLYFVEKIINNEISSAQMCWTENNLSDEYYTIKSKSFLGWVINKGNSKYDIPFQFSKNEDGSYTSKPKIKIIEFKSLNKIFGINILELDNSHLINRNKLIKIFDKKTRMRLFLPEELQSTLRKEYLSKYYNPFNGCDSKLLLDVEIIMDHNFYIEYYIKGINNSGGITSFIHFDK